MKNKAVFIFRRDLRLEDNLGLIYALANSKVVIPCFILDPRQSKDNLYFSDNAFSFMIESLEELNQDLNNKGSHLYLFEGAPEAVISTLLQKEDIDLIVVNKDYTPFSKSRDKKIEEVCLKNNVQFISCPGILLNDTSETLKSDKKPYTIFTPYWKNASKIPVIAPQKNEFNNYCNKKINLEIDFPEIEKKPLRAPGGRSNALKILKKIGAFKEYVYQRDVPKLDATTKLSPHLKFGTISIREFYIAVAQNLGEDHPLIRQMYWRDFFHHIADNFPQVFGAPFKPAYSRIRWQNNKNHIHAWMQGKTGFPIVDAGMRELNTTGYMHNRVRMIVSSFLTKDLHVDWRIGERYFAQNLTDYDPCLNNGNWQWAASTGCDAQPYFRIFNPWLQQKKFDETCEYIKKWVPELREIDPKIIHLLDKNEVSGYPRPIVNHREESKVSLHLYTAAITQSKY